MRRTAIQSCLCLLVRLWIHPVGNISETEVAGSYGLYTFGFPRFCQTAFQSGCSKVHCHQQCIRVPVAPHPHQHLLLSIFSILAALIDELEVIVTYRFCLR